MGAFDIDSEECGAKVNAGPKRTRLGLGEPPSSASLQTEAQMRSLALGALVASALFLPLAARGDPVPAQMTFSVPGIVTSSANFDGVPVGLTFDLAGSVDLISFPDSDPVTAIPRHGMFSFTLGYDPDGPGFSFSLPSAGANEGTTVDGPTFTFDNGKLIDIDYLEIGIGSGGFVGINSSTVGVSYDPIPDPNGGLPVIPSYTGTLDFADATFAGVPTPEPAEWALLLVGFASVGSVLRKVRRSQVAGGFA
jgi:hypothetical protein